MSKAPHTIDILQMELDGQTPSPWLGKSRDDVRRRHASAARAKAREEAARSRAAKKAVSKPEVTG